MRTYSGRFLSPVGLLTAVVDDKGSVKRFHFGPLDEADAIEDAAAVAPVRRQVEEYFAGERRDFDLELTPDGTGFQRAVWQGLRTIPFGQTMSYGALAERVGYRGAFRAIGAANGANPIALIIPCHRVIGGDGRLTGFGGGIPIKAWLLAHEGVLPQAAVRNADRLTRVGEARNGAQGALPL